MDRFFGSDAALQDLLNEWKASDKYPNRVAHLGGAPGGLNGTNFLRVGTDVQDDGAVDALTGEDGRDWFFSQLGADALVDKASNESED